MGASRERRSQLRSLESVTVLSTIWVQRREKTTEPIQKSFGFRLIWSLLAGFREYGSNPTRWNITSGQKSISTSTRRVLLISLRMGNLLVRSQFWSVSGSKNNTKKESDPLSAPKCQQEVYRRDFLPNWILTAWHFHRSEVEFRFALAIGWNRAIWTV